MPVPTAVPPSARRYTPRSAFLYTLQVVAKHPHVARPFLAERDRVASCMLRATDLNQIFHSVGLRRDRIAQRLTAGISRSFTLTGRCYVIAVGKESLRTATC